MSDKNLIDFHRRVLLWRAFATVGAWPLAACGGGESPSEVAQGEPPATPPPPSSPAPAPTPEPAPAPPPDPAPAPEPAPAPAPEPPPAPTPEPPPAPLPPPTGTLVQYISHDGDMVGNSPTSSAPTQTFWNSVLLIRWKRGGWGDWMDATQSAFGGSTAGAVPYASVPVPAPGRYSANVTTLVQRWKSNGLNRGFYLRMRANAFPVYFAGRTAASDADRPKLTVTTSAGTVTLTARCNAHWVVGSSSVWSNSGAWRLSGEHPAILHFDLSTVAGTVTSAVLSFTDTAHDAGSTSANGVVDVYECDPPQIYDVSNYATPQQGLAGGKTYAELAAIPAVQFHADMSTPGAFDRVSGAEGWVDPPVRYTDDKLQAVAARQTLHAGNLASCAIKVDLVRGTGVSGAVDRTLDELYARYAFYLDGNFGDAADECKIPAIGCQLGYWVTNAAFPAGGYWETNQTGGNGGARASGKKVRLSNGKWGYAGHSVRLIASFRASDNSAYAHLHALRLYPYNLDQVGPFPAFYDLSCVISRESWFWIDIRQKMNTMSGVQDADGNYATANADGIYEVWINGFKAISKTDFRWRLHPEIGVQGFWLDVYHGGVTPAAHDMGWRVGPVTMATQYIGPPS